MPTGQRATATRSARRGRVAAISIPSWEPVPPEQTAADAQCRYVDDASPGIRRHRSGKGHRYVSPLGATVRDPNVLARIRSLVIPPAWTDVWICPQANGHIQATGRDARGRKQYRYHPRFRALRDETKYGRMLAFACVLPRIRDQVDAHLGRPGLGRERILATVVRLLESTLIRIGNEEYARDNGSFGLTTLRTRHVDVDGSTVSFRFRGKSGKVHTVDVRDRRISRVVARCHDLPGEQLFQYVDDEGESRSIESADVNAYIRETAAQEHTAKDFRTWAGTVLAAKALRELAPFESDTAAKRNVVAVVKDVAARLGNTPAVCRRCYVHPEVLTAYHEGALTMDAEAAKRMADALRDELPSLSSDERFTLALLRQRTAPREERTRRAA